MVSEGLFVFLSVFSNITEKHGGLVNYKLTPFLQWFEFLLETIELTSSSGFLILLPNKVKVFTFYHFFRCI